MKKFLGKLLYSKNSIKSKQIALTNLVHASTKVTAAIQNNIATLQSTNGEIDSTIKEIEDMKTQYNVLEAELQNRKAQNESYISMFTANKQ